MHKEITILEKTQANDNGYRNCNHCRIINHVILPPSSPGLAIMFAVLFPCESSRARSPKKSPFFKVFKSCSPPNEKIAIQHF